VRALLVLVAVAASLLTPAVASTTGRATDVLATLAVKGRAPKTGYSREQFGAAWSDVDHNGCDTRNDVLNRDLAGKQWRPGTHDCVVVAGTVTDPYTGRVLTFAKARAWEVQVDHVVALSDAWQKGAQQWDATKRRAFANDPLELLAVDGPTNARKGDGDAATWLPPRKPFRCTYVARQIAVKAGYGLWVTPAEHDAMARVLGTCPGQRVPT
jgi:hypothetical protein